MQSYEIYRSRLKSHPFLRNTTLINEKRATARSKSRALRYSLLRLQQKPSSLCALLPLIAQSCCFRTLPTIASKRSIRSTIKSTECFHVLEECSVWIINTLWFWCSSRFLLCNWWSYDRPVGSQRNWCFWLRFWGSALSPNSYRCRNLKTSNARLQSGPKYTFSEFTLDKLLYKTWITEVLWWTLYNV